MCKCGSGFNDPLAAIASRSVDWLAKCLVGKRLTDVVVDAVVAGSPARPAGSDASQTEEGRVARTTTMGRVQLKLYDIKSSIGQRIRRL